MGLGSLVEFFFFFLQRSYDWLKPRISRISVSPSLINLYSTCKLKCHRRVGWLVMFGLIWVLCLFSSFFKYFGLLKGWGLFG